MKKVLPSLKLYRLALVVLIVAVALTGLSYKSKPVRAAATITVNSAADDVDDDGECTLREAIIAANTDTASGATTGECIAGDGSDTIVFNIAPLDSSIKTLTPATPYPAVTEAVTIDGSTQDDANCATHTLRIEVDGTDVPGPGNNTLHFLSTGNSTLRGIAFYGYTGGNFMVNFRQTTDARIVCNNFGTRADGSNGYPGDTSRSGGLQLEGTLDTVVGGATAFDRNVFSHNISQSGISIHAHSGTPDTNARIIGNYFGTSIDGTTAAPNGQPDISFTAALNIQIGGSATGEGNLFVANNTSFGSILLSSTNGSVLTHGARIQGNTFGLNSAGFRATDFGVTPAIMSGYAPPGLGVTEPLIGGTAAGEGNTIATTATAITNFGFVGFPAVTGQSILGNTIYDASFGIDHCEDSDFDLICDIQDGLTANDAGDVDTGPNNYINSPEITDITQAGNQLTIIYDLDAIDSPSDTYRVEFFYNDTADSEDMGQGQYWLGATTADLSGGAATGLSATFTLPNTTDITSKVFAATTTAIDSSTEYGFGPTSEFGGEVLGATSSYTPASPEDEDNNPGSNNNGDSEVPAQPGNGALARTGQDVRLFITVALFIILVASLAGIRKYAKH